jgi:hypothetical protein
MLRVASESFDADGFLRDHAQLSPEALWHKGERRVIGGAALTNGFNLLGLDPFYQQVTLGVILLLAVGLDAWSRRAESSG